MNRHCRECGNFNVKPFIRDNHCSHVNHFCLSENEFTSCCDFTLKTPMEDIEMTDRITEVRHFCQDEKDSFVVDILRVPGPVNGYVQPDGSTGKCFQYEFQRDAVAAEALYLAKNAEEFLGVETSAEGKTCGECEIQPRCGTVHHEDTDSGNCLSFKPKDSAEEITPGKKQWGHPAFYKLLEQMADLHSRKNHDYAGKNDPLKNLRACERLDLKPFLGVMVRLQDKWSRLEEFVKSGQLMVKNESVIDTLMDNAVYSLLAIILYQEAQAGEK